MSHAYDSTWLRCDFCIAKWEKYRTLVFAVYSLSHVQLFAIPWTVACQALLSLGFLRQESVLHFLLQGIFCPWTGLLYSLDFPGKKVGSISFSKGSSWPRDWTHIACIGRWIVHHWATREAHKIFDFILKLSDPVKWSLTKGIQTHGDKTFESSTSHHRSTMSWLNQDVITTIN